MDALFTRQCYLYLLYLVLSLFSTAAHAVFINEIHYDNVSDDTGEAVELAGVAGVDLSGWSLYFYNGSNGTVYDSLNLSGIIPDQQAGHGVLNFSHAPIQNGAPDGIALIDGASSVIQFLSYEGSFTASGGPADGETSTDIGVSESTTEAVGSSLQLTGTGNLYSDFSWTSSNTNSFGGINANQTFIQTTDDENVVSVPQPASLMLMSLGIAVLLLVRHQRASQTRWRPAGNVPAPA